MRIPLPLSTLGLNRCVILYLDILSSDKRSRDYYKVKELSHQTGGCSFCALRRKGAFNKASKISFITIQYECHDVTRDIEPYGARGATGKSSLLSWWSSGSANRKIYMQAVRVTLTFKRFSYGSVNPKPSLLMRSSFFVRRVLPLSIIQKRNN